MKTYVVEFEILLKDTADLEWGDDFIIKAIEEQLEPGEFVDNYYIEEKRVKS